MYGSVVDGTGIVFVSLKQVTKEPKIPRQVEKYLGDPRSHRYIAIQEGISMRKRSVEIVLSFQDTFHLNEFCLSLNLICLFVGKNFIPFWLIFTPKWICLRSSTLLCINKGYWLVTEWYGTFYQVDTHLWISVKVLIFNHYESKKKYASQLFQLSLLFFNL